MAPRIQITLCVYNVGARFGRPLIYSSSHLQCRNLLHQLLTNQWSITFQRVSYTNVETKRHRSAKKYTELTRSKHKSVNQLCNERMDDQVNH